MGVKNIVSPENIIWGKGENNIDPIPKIIWIFWNSEKKSPLVNLCVQQIKSILPDYNFHILNFKNLNTFLPNITKYREELSIANYTDLIRLRLLQKYGGIWVDASILLTKNLDWVFSIKSQYKADVIGFYSDFFTSDWEFPLLESWFIASSPNNKFISAWANEFDKCYTSAQPSLYFNKEKQSSAFCHKLDNTLSNYLIAYLAAQKIMRNNQNFRLYMLAANSTGHYYNFGLQLEPHQLQEFFLFKKYPPPQKIYIPMLIKFEKRGRNAIDEAIKRGHYSKKSLLFQIVPQKNFYLKKIPRLGKYCLFILKNILRKYAK